MCVYECVHACMHAGHSTNSQEAFPSAITKRPLQEHFQKTSVIFQIVPRWRKTGHRGPKTPCVRVCVSGRGCIWGCDEVGLAGCLTRRLSRKQLLEEMLPWRGLCMCLQYLQNILWCACGKKISHLETNVYSPVANCPTSHLSCAK